MRLTGINLAPSFIISFVACVCLPSAGTRTNLRAQPAAQLAAQPARQTRVVRSPEGARGLEAYQKGDFKAAVTFLEQATKTRRDDATSWHFLGLAYQQLAQENDARKALENALLLRLLQLAPGASGKTTKPWNELSAEEREARRRESLGHYREALSSVESYLRLNPKTAEFWRQQYEGLSFYVRNEEKPEAEKEAFHSSDETITKAKVISKASPDTTREARRNRTSGTVVLRALLASDGSVKHIIALVMLPDGLTDRAMAAMRQVKFTPATKNGRPVSQWVTFEYNFYFS